MNVLVGAGWAESYTRRPVMLVAWSAPGGGTSAAKTNVGAVPLVNFKVVEDLDRAPG
jgi:hypothetical protein